MVACCSQPLLQKFLAAHRNRLVFFVKNVKVLWPDMDRDDMGRICILATQSAYAYVGTVCAQVGPDNFMAIYCNCQSCDGHNFQTHAIGLEPVEPSHP